MLYFFPNVIETEKGGGGGEAKMDVTNKVVYRRPETQLRLICQMSRLLVVFLHSVVFLQRRLASPELV